MAHPNKTIREAIDYAVEKGWRFVKSGGRAHAYGKLYSPSGERNGCWQPVYGTPKTPELHALRIRRKVDACPHGT